MPSARKVAGSETRRRILDAAIVVVDLDGDAALRVTDIADRARVAPGLINFHFGSRDGLVAAVQAERYAGVVESELDLFETIIEQSETREAAVEAFHAVFAHLATRDLAEVRMSRASALGAAHGRPDLQEVLSEKTAELVDRAAEVLSLGQAQGVIRSDVDSRAAASVILGLSWGLCVVDFDMRRAQHDDVSKVITVMIDSLLPPDLFVDG
jgi:AcrR family transcriptional regulator